MSYYLCVIEFGKIREPPKAKPPLQLWDVRIRPRGPNSVPRSGYAITDGVDSGRLREIGNSEVARIGAALRGAVAEFALDRLAAGAEILMFFHWEDNFLSNLVTDARNANEVSVSDLGATLTTLSDETPILIRNA